MTRSLRPLLLRTRSGSALLTFIITNACGRRVDPVEASDASLPGWVCLLCSLETLLVDGNPFQGLWKPLV